MAKMGRKEAIRLNAPQRKDAAIETIRHYRSVWREEGTRGLRHPVARTNQDEVPFTGERLVINERVKTAHVPVIEEHLLRYDFACRFAAGQIVLDAACGTGFGAKMLEEAGALEVCAVDIDEASLNTARSAYAGERVRFVRADIRQLPLPAESFDLAVSFETIEHIPQGRDWIREAARVLKPGGLMLISTPNREATNPGLYLEELPANPFHFYEYSTTEFVGELLTEFDVLELYGQTLQRKAAQPLCQAARQWYGRNLAWAPAPTPATQGHELVPFAEIKNAEPTLIVAVCRKKSP